MAEPTLDLICIGRAAVDFYGEQIGSRLEDMTSFAKYLGGCAANIAFGTARLGLRSAMLSRVGDEHMGRFVREALAGEGVDVSQLRTDPRRLTGLVVLGVRDREQFPLIFYRENCADMALDTADVDPAFIASSKAVLITGTHLSQPGPAAACRRAVELAHAAGRKVIFDIDYRPVLWGLTGLGRGEDRYVASAPVTARLQELLPLCDLIVGTEEEMAIAGGHDEPLAALEGVRKVSRALLVMKRGPLGCVMFDGAIPARVEDGLVVKGFPVEIFNVLGAGDAFMSGFLSGWLRDQPLEYCAERANACGALVVARHACAPSMPDQRELADYLARRQSVGRVPRLDPRLTYLHRIAGRHGDWPELLILAFDHRQQLEAAADRAGADRGRIAAFKALVARAMEQVGGDLAGSGALVDDRYGQDVLDRLTGEGWWLARPVELPGSRPLEFEHGPDIALTLRTWPAEHIAKCLVFYHADDPPELRARQEERLLALQAACWATSRELLLEVIPPRDRQAERGAVADAVAALYRAGLRPDYWKLPPPDAAGWAALDAIIKANDPHCRGVLLLGLERPESELARSFAAAAGQTLCRGFAVGRSVFLPAAEAWLAGRLDDEAAVAEVAGNYRRLVRLWQRRAG
jgi:5-dehydro-2-deoxygluconokinase